MEQTAPIAAPAPEAPKSAVNALFADKKASAKLTADSAGGKEAASLPGTTPSKPEEAPPPKTDSVAKQMALIARESKRLAAEKEALHVEREQAKTALEELKQLRALREEMKANPLKGLKGFGLDYNELIKAELQRQQEDADPTLKKVRELEHKLSEKERIEAETQVKYAQAQQQRYIDQHVSDIRAHIAANAEKFEFLSTYKAEKDVFAKIKEVFDGSVKKDAEGRIKEFKELSIEEACNLVEAEFEESASALTKLKKIQNKFTKQTDPEAPKSAAKAETKEKPKSGTLTNALNGSSEKPRALTRAERAERAFAALHGN